MEYRITRLLEPELEPVVGSAAARRGWLRPWMGLGLLILVPGLLSGNRRDAAAAAPAPPERIEARGEIPLDEWIQIVGIAPAVSVEDVEPPRPQWSIRLPDEGETSGAQQLLVGNAQSLRIGTLPVSLGRLVKMFDAADSQAQLSAAGGQTHLVGGDLPPWMWADTQSVPVATQVQSVFVTLPPMLDGSARMRGIDAWIEGVNYTDPTGVGLPLLRAGGFENHRLSEHFTVENFQTNDYAPYFRVAADLVAGLENMREAVGPITVISGYRHPRYNARADVRGAPNSRHQSGQAADIYAGTESTIEIARAAIQKMGCGIGLGLGPNTVHVDVRGYLSTWTYPGAPLSESAFDRWILALCGGSAPQAPARTRQMTNDEWLALIADGSQDEAEVIHTDLEAVEEAIDDAADAPALVPLEQRVERDLSEFAAASYQRQGRGVVVVDLRDGAQLEGDALLRRARYVPASMPELRRMQVDGLLQWTQTRPSGAFFVYAVQRPNGQLQTGVATVAGAQPGVTLPSMRPSPSDPSTSLPRRDTPETGPEAPTAKRWHLLLAAAPSLAAVEQEVTYYRTALGATGYTIAPYIGGGGDGASYRVAIGPFATQSEAEAAMRRLRPFIGTEVELAEVGL